jgi:hypothetical protein
MEVIAARGVMRALEYIDRCVNDPWGQPPDSLIDWPTP